jgi:hypothetical protein
MGMGHRAWSTECGVWRMGMEKGILIHKFIDINIKNGIMSQFRFMDLDIWKDSIALNNWLFDLADAFTDVKSFRVAEQLRAASLSISK